MQSDGKIFVLHADDRTEPLGARNYWAEDWLQILAKEHPEILADGQISPDAPRKWLVFSGEQATSRDQRSALWSLDYLFLDRDGVPTLVLVRRRSYVRTRHELVGRTLARAATLTDCWPAQQIRARFEEDCARNGDCSGSAVREFLGVAGDAAESSVDEFWQRVERNSRIKRLRLLFVADYIPAPLRRVVEFLHEALCPTEALAVEIQYCKGGGIKALGPKVFGQTKARKARADSGRGVSVEATFLNAIRAHSTANSNVSAAVEELLAWSKLSGLNLEFTFGSLGHRCSISLPGTITLLRIEAGDQDASSVVVGLQETVPFNSPAGRDLLHRMLEGFPGYSVESEGSNRWPVLNLSKVVEQNRLIDFVKVVDWMVGQCEPAGTSGLMLGSNYLN